MNESLLTNNNKIFTNQCVSCLRDAMILANITYLSKGKLFQRKKRNKRTYYRRGHHEYHHIVEAWGVKLIICPSAVEASLNVTGSIFSPLKPVR